jgi:predicted nucleic acid-binding protein
MITALDTNVLLDCFVDDPTFGPAAREALKKARQQGSVSITELTYAELAPLHVNREALDHKLDLLDILVEPIGRDACFAAGQAFARYRRRQPGRGRILPDFLIGAHALRHADALLTRDRGFYRAYFRELRIIEPLDL